MLHRHILQLLMPVELGVTHQADLAVTGGHLDQARDRADQLLRETMPDLASGLLAEWERVCGVAAQPGDTLQIRQGRVLIKLRDIGRLDRAYYIQLAAALGYQITISEFGVLRAGDRAGDCLGDETSMFVWRVNIADGGGIRPFKAGRSRAGEPLRSWGNQLLESTIEELAPAHTHLLFGYGG